MLQEGRSRVRLLMESLIIFNLSHLYSCTVAKEFTELLTEMSTSCLPEG
jgi:hypothetical protein